MLPTKDRLTICFAHVAYQLRERFLARDLGIASFQVRSPDELERRIGEADVLAVSGLWHNALLPHAGKEILTLANHLAGLRRQDRPATPQALYAGEGFAQHGIAGDRRNIPLGVVPDQPLVDAILIQAGE